MSNTHRHCWSVWIACVLAACVDGNPVDAGVDAARSDAKVELDAHVMWGDDARTYADASVDDASSHDAHVDAAPDHDANVVLTPRTPTAACGTDVNVDNGAVISDVGVPLLLTQSVTGDLASIGVLTRTSSELMIAVPSTSRDYGPQSVSITAATLPATAYVPAGDGPFPLVIVLPGFQANRTLYSAFADHLASWGFIAVGIDTRSDALSASHDKEALEVSASIDWLLSQSAFKDRIDATKIAVAGHSKGGKVAFFASVLDARIDIVIGWDPVNAGGGPCAFDANCNRLPVAPNCAVMEPGLQHWMSAESLVIGAPPDALLNPDAHHNAVQFYRGAPSPAWLVVLGVGHGAWAANSATPELNLTRRTHLALLLTRFYGATGLEPQLPGGAVLGAEALVQSHERK